MEPQMSPEQCISQIQLLNREMHTPESYSVTWTWRESDSLKMAISMEEISMYSLEDGYGKMVSITDMEQDMVSDISYASMKALKESQSIALKYSSQA